MNSTPPLPTSVPTAFTTPITIPGMPPLTVSATLPSDFKLSSLGINLPSIPLPAPTLWAHLKSRWQALHLILYSQANASFSHSKYYYSWQWTKSGNNRHEKHVPSSQFTYIVVVYVLFFTCNGFLCLINYYCLSFYSQLFAITSS